jgi:nucleotide-binding universal stress UspA family protein
MPELPELSARNVLVAVDGTPQSWDAVALAVQIARSRHGRLTLLSVVVPAPAWTQVGLFAPPADGSAEQAAERHLRELVDAIPDEIPVTSQLLRGDAAHEIAARVKDDCFDLVVLAAHERGPIAAAFESVARRLLKLLDVPVLAIHVPSSESAAPPDPRDAPPVAEADPP